MGWIKRMGDETITMRGLVLVVIICEMFDGLGHWLFSLL